METITAADRWRSLGQCWSIVTPFVVAIGGIYAGFFTPSEAAGAGAISALVLALIAGVPALSLWLPGLLM